MSCAPIVILSNGIRIANFSSPHPFHFVDGSVLESCSAERCKSLSAEAIEVASVHPGGWTDIDLSFELGEACLDELEALDANDDIDVVLAPLPIVQAARAAGVGRKARTVRMADRVEKKAHIDRFCL